ncbi:DUF6614 family protein [Pelagibius sp. Alg239-R121]|uniref:DUF6614 family protein n=1 Tax=Pelagibius sp. Alg239-R121 TaxID=2993448 RepID=UPI003460D5FD
MFGAFDLQAGNDLVSFKKAFDGFCEHLRQQGHVHSWRLWERLPHGGYDNRPPPVPILVEMRFHDHPASLACYKYVEANQEPLRTLHRSMNQQINDTFFALYRELG